MRIPSYLARPRRQALPGPALLAGLLLAAVAGSAHADPDAGKRKAESCVACHGPMGNASNPLYPVLAGQTARYIYLELKDFKEGRRSDPMMTPMAAPLSREDMLDLGEYFAAQKPIASQFKADGQKVEAGRKKAEEVLCTMCHLGGFTGQNEIPRVAGQQYAYIVKQLEDFRSRKRTNDAGSMTSVARGLSDADIQNLASYIANLQ
ncbi:c-type cytochrome [Cupriavidus basilensis]|uniref:c-type cytochrome n=1 Tax=Cupriavidus basilensis TaxID=68895 RepID=UPI0020A6C826|nr:c-type cytochrome [Cupriavidus basilensis]MCP3021199.1 cytochrome c4 [Cupriavidus basilensis]MDR3382622.1 c-type cytochrome [Cupriavidus basilensis]